MNVGPTPVRCQWCSNDPLYQQYHDEEWGVPHQTPRHLFEMLILEGVQAGLAWITVLRKREHYREVYRNFDAQFMARQTDDDIERLARDPRIIRNRLKLRAARQNAQAWLRLAEQEDPVQWLWQFTGGRPRINHFSSHAQVPAVTNEALAMSRALKRAGFSFVGPTICYAFMQATGMVMDHTRDCFRYVELGGDPAAAGTR